MVFIYVYVYTYVVYYAHKTKVYGVNMGCDAGFQTVGIRMCFE